MKSMCTVFITLVFCLPLHAQADDIESGRNRTSSLDQGGESCATATQIFMLPYVDSGVLGTTNNCAATPYRDVFYIYFGQTNGAHTFDMCGTTGDTYMRAIMGPCCNGQDIDADNQCATNAPQITVALEVGQRVYLECGNAGMFAPAQAYTFHASGPNPVIPGDHCSNALTLPGIPSSVSGNTCGFLDDFNASCEWLFFGSKDVVYRYISTTTQLVNLDVCQSDFDTRLYVFDGACQGDPVACNDETPGCGPSGHGSRIECFQMLASHEYYIVVDGWDSDACGSFVLTAGPCSQCEVECPPAAIPEGEVICYEGYSDHYNGGCWGTPQVFTPIGCNNVICGNFGSWSVASDIDWYQLSLSSRTNISWCIYAQYAAELWIFSPPCFGTILATGLGAACDTFCLEACLDPGEYYLMAEPWHFGETVCGTPYYAWVNCQPCEPQFACSSRFIPDTHCDLYGGPIPDVNTLTAEVNVPLQYSITDVDVSLDIMHPSDGSLQIRLVSPLGTNVDLCLNRGGLGQNFACTTFDDEANISISAGTAPFAGRFRPESLLAAFDGQNAAGVWQLMITDEAFQDVGWLQGFCLTFEYDQILPVQLADFSAIEGDRFVTLRWRTAAELELSHFIISRDEVPVRQVAASNQPTGSEYSWDDRGVENGITYTYTLASADILGNMTDLGTLQATPYEPVVSDYVLHQNYPNPFNSTTAIRYQLPQSAHVRLDVLTLTGRHLATLVNAEVSSGDHVVIWNADALATGIYLCRFDAGGSVRTQKMLLLK